MENTLNRITAVLGPTNTGKTHLAVETMLGYQSGILGFPLRLLAREIFDKCVKKIGPEKVALITGEEKVIPRSSKYYKRRSVHYNIASSNRKTNFRILILATVNKSIF